MKAKVVLVTGFLGAGKTTFLEGYLNYLKERSQSVVVVENEFGKAGVDASILENKGADITQLTGGCICCGQKVNFHDKLIMLAQTYDRILVEPSGIYTLEDFYDICESPKVKECCEIQGIFTIVDPGQLRSLSGEEREIFYSQAAGAGALVVSKITEATDCETIKEEITRQITDIFEEYGNFSPLKPEAVLAKPWSSWSGKDYEQLERKGFIRNRINLKKQDHSTLFQSVTVSPVFASYDKMEAYMKHLLDGSCGTVIRAKGYLQLETGETWEVNCTQDSWHVHKTVNAQQMGVNVIGRGLNRRKMKALLG